MNVIFWGSPEFAVPTLRALQASRHRVVGVVTQPDRPRGRGRSSAPTPVAVVARAADVPVLMPARPGGEPFLSALRSLGADIQVVAAYGAILPPAVLDLPPHGSLNVHASLLPAYRGAAPVTRAILDGRDVTGVTIMRMDAGLDTGPICLQAEAPIGPSDTAASVTARLAELGARLAVEALDRLERGELPERAQDPARATYAPKVATADAALDWSRPAAELERAARAYDPWPGAWTTWRGERLKVLRLTPVATGAASPASRSPAGKPDAVPGTVVAVDPAPLVRAGDGVLTLERVQPPGGRSMSGGAWARGRGVAPGQRLGGDEPVERPRPADG